MEDLPVSFLKVQHFNACGRRFSDCEYSFRSGSELRITGAIIDTIEKVCRCIFNLAVPRQQTQSLQKGARFADCGDLDLKKGRYPRYCGALLLESDSALIPVVHQRIKGQRIKPEYNKEVREVEASLSNWPRYRRLCITRGDRFVWAPSRGHSSTDTGDKIAIFKGGRVPYVIRPRGDGSYTLVGECWVEGLMEGEAVEAPDFKLEEIVLK